MSSLAFESLSGGVATSSSSFYSKLPPTKRCFDDIQLSATPSSCYLSNLVGSCLRMELSDASHEK